MSSILQQTDDGIYYVEIASIKFGAIGDKERGLYGIVPKYEVGEGGKGLAIRVKSFKKEDVLRGVYKYKEDVFRFIFVDELRSK